MRGFEGGGGLLGLGWGGGGLFASVQFSGTTCQTTYILNGLILICTGERHNCLLPGRRRMHVRDSGLRKMRHPWLPGCQNMLNCPIKQVKFDLDLHRRTARSLASRAPKSTRLRIRCTKKKVRYPLASQASNNALLVYIIILF